jgi:hypothetical protein
MLRVFDPDVLVQHIHPSDLNFPLLARVHLDNMSQEQRNALWPLLLAQQHQLQQHKDYDPAAAVPPLYVLLTGWQDTGTNLVASVAQPGPGYSDHDPIWLSWGNLSPDLTLLPN